MSDFTDKNPKWFYESGEHPELRILEEQFPVILAELQNLRKQSANNYWFETFPEYQEPGKPNTWKVFTFKFFGIRHEANCSFCPQTAALIEQLPSLVTAEFSYLPANTQIKPHKGFTKMVLRVHLGLIIPGQCGLRVGDETRTWEPGKLLVFDDSFEHEAWNNSNEDRFVLMMDIPNPTWNYTAKEICKYKIDTLQDQFLLNLFPKEQWQHFLEVGRFDALPAQH